MTISYYKNYEKQVYHPFPNFGEGIQGNIEVVLHRYRSVKDS